MKAEKGCSWLQGRAKVTARIKGCIVRQGFNNRNKSNWKPTFHYHHLLLILNNVNNKMLFPDKNIFLV